MKQRHGILLVIAAAMLWGTDSLFRRPLTQSFSPVTIVFLEHVVLVIAMLPFLLRSSGAIRKLGRHDWTALIIIAIGGSVAATSLFTFAIKHGNPSVTVLLQKTQLLFTLLLARWLLTEKPGSRFWLCLVPAAGGAYLVSTPEWRAGFSPETGQPVTVLAAVGASALWGASTVLGRYIVARVPVFVLTGLRFAVALPALAILFVLQPAAARTLPPTFGTLITLVAMALIPGMAALVFYYRGLQITPATTASIGELAFPVTAVTVNWLVLGIGMSASQLLGGSVLVAAMTFLTFQGSPARTE